MQVAAEVSAHVGERARIRAANNSLLQHDRWSGSRQCSLPGGMNAALPSCLNRSDGKVILFVLPH